MSNMNAYGRKGHERKRLYTNAYGKERKTKPQMMVANEKWLPLIRQANEKWLP